MGGSLYGGFCCAKIYFGDQGVNYVQHYLNRG